MYRKMFKHAERCCDMPLLSARNSLDLESIICAAGYAVVAFVDPEDSSSETLLAALRAAAAASPKTVFVEARLPDVADYMLEHGVLYAPLVAVYRNCRIVAALPGPVGLEELKRLLDAAEAPGE
jgi:hypothetical protein